MNQIVIELLGVVPSKKNTLRVSKIKRKGQRGVHLDPRTKIKRQRGVHLDTNTQGLINDLILQVPGKYRGLLLEHPDVHVKFWCANNLQDRDGKLVTLLDVLQTTRVIHNDNIKFFNGSIKLLPAQTCKAGQDKTQIELFSA